MLTPGRTPGLNSFELTVRLATSRPSQATQSSHSLQLRPAPRPSASPAPLCSSEPGLRAPPPLSSLVAHGIVSAGSAHCTEDDGVSRRVSEVRVAAADPAGRPWRGGETTSTADPFSAQGHSQDQVHWCVRATACFSRRI